jgi:hypothetical protein
MAHVLRESGYGEDTQVLALLHDVVEDTRVRDGDVRGPFGDEVADMVAALTEDDTIDHYLPPQARPATSDRRCRPAGRGRLAGPPRSRLYAMPCSPEARSAGASSPTTAATPQLALGAGEAPRLSGQLDELLGRFT